ncbi:MAG TPA: mannose-6-phosphate isomerase, class I [Chitinophagaceae bacterium]|nr:mannose-6-phosphate isomerase, class I [Chitinophagaceae bacterium]
MPVFHLKGIVKQYDWGGFSLIPSLLKEPNSNNQPFAEYWMGTHPLGDAMVVTHDGQKPLSSLVDPLPYLFKVLDVKDMLSIQVHPSKEAAEKEFARENEAGIPVDSSQRNYKDDNHKPELMVALSDFWLLHGFKPPEELVYTLLNVVELREMLPIFNQSGYSGLYTHIMTLPQAEVNRILQPLITNLDTIYKDNDPDKYDEDHWVQKAAKAFNRDGNIDRGIFSIYLFNLVHLKKGEGIFQAAGVPHAYLEGQNVEIMANSDNVLRGGLTNKHIDVGELLKHVKCEATYPAIITGEALDAITVHYKAPVNDFSLDRIELAVGKSIQFIADTTTILLATEGAVIINKEINLGTGHPVAVVFPGTSYTITGASEGSTIFRASSPA